MRRRSANDFAASSGGRAATKRMADYRGARPGTRMDVQFPSKKSAMVGNYQEIARIVKFSVITSQSLVRGRDSSQTSPGSSYQGTHRDTSGVQQNK